MAEEINIKKEIEEIFSGNIYRKIGLKDDPFKIDPKNKINLFVDRNEQINKLIRSVRNMLEGFQPHIGILGSHGIGKTHFLEFVYETLDMYKEKLGVSRIFYVKGKRGFIENFLRTSFDNSPIVRYRKENPNEKILVFFDDLDVLIRRYPKEVANLFDTFNCCIVGTWDTYAWNNQKNNMDFKIPKTDAVYLDRLEQNYSVELLRKRLGEVWLKNNKAGKVFPDFVIERLAIISEGNPYRLVTYAKRYLDFVFDNGISEIDERGFEKFCNKINIKLIEDIKKGINELTDKQKDMLRFIIELSEVSAQEVSNRFNMTRVAGMHNLKRLKEKNLLESKTKNRIDFYYVPTDIIFEISDYMEKLKEQTANKAEITS